MGCVSCTLNLKVHDVSLRICYFSEGCSVVQLAGTLHLFGRPSVVTPPEHRTLCWLGRNSVTPNPLTGRLSCVWLNSADNYSLFVFTLPPEVGGGARGL